MISLLSQFVPTVWAVAEGIPTTLAYSFIPLLVAFAAGTALALAKLAAPKPIRWFVNFYVSIFRGTPLVIQLMVIAYGLPVITGVKLSAFFAGILAFSLNSAAYVCEIIRAGIEGIDKGQCEAASALSIPYSQSMQDIILPQALKRVLPTLVSESINLVKESAIISMLPGTGFDITRQAQIISMQNYSFLEPMLAAAICYYIITSCLNIAGSMLEDYLQKAQAHD
jgi:His/Glu/Gln/Arg/opine family amino acid ABC transporter permease subunit